MPDKPLWFDRLPDAIRELEQDPNPNPWVHRPAIEALLGVGRRRAQQLLAPLADRYIGTSLVARRADMIAYLKRLAAGEQAWYEGRRRKRLWAELDRTRREPHLIIETSEDELRQLRSQDLDGLPAGVDLSPSSITLRFDTLEDALRKLMALAIAIGQNREGFEERVAPAKGSSGISGV